MTNRGFERAPELEKSLSHRLWLEMKPSNSITRLSDETFKFGMKLFVGHLDIPRGFNCEKAKAECKTDNAAFTNHFLSCSTCNNTAIRVRHEKVNNVLHRTLKFYAVTSDLNPKHIPLPEKRKGGPDLIVYAEKTYIIDVCVTKCRSGTSTDTSNDRIYSDKQKKYSSFKDRWPAMKFVPFAMTVYGRISSRSLKDLEKWKLLGGNNLIRDISDNVQAEMLRGMSQGYDTLKYYCLMREVGDPIVPVDVVVSDDEGINEEDD